MSKLIIGHTTDKTVKVWVRASERWPVAIVQLFDQAERKMGTPKIKLTAESEFFTHVFELNGLSPNGTYKVKLYFAKDVDASHEEWIRHEYTEGNFTAFPSSGNHCRFVFGSCNLHTLDWIDKPDKAWIQISKVAKLNQANFMLHCGDQIYADIPFRSKPSLKHYRKKYLDAWDNCIPAKRVLTELPHYMILDDHEITNNYAQDMKFRNKDPNALANFAMKVYWEFQHSHNPDTSDDPYQYDYTFKNGDIQFFVMDTRYRRNSTARGSVGQMIDEKQQGRLFEWLIKHKNKVKFIVSSVPFVGVIKDDNDDKWCSKPYQDQRNEIISFIHENKIQRTCFLTGDMHNSYHAKLTVTDNTRNTYIHELMSSPINQITPNTNLDSRYATKSSGKNHWQLPSGHQVVSRITRNSFYGNHSNITAVEVVDTQTIKYKVYRTSNQSSAPAKRGSFNLLS